MADCRGYLTIIPARAGSQRLPGKNMRQLGDKPLVGHSLAYAQDNGFSNMVVTSNDARVLEYAKEVGVLLKFLTWYRENRLLQFLTRQPE